MNAVVSIDKILSPVTIEQALTPAIVFAPGGVETLIAKVEAEVRATPRDITTAEGREAVKSLAYKVARSKTALDEMGKELVAGIKAQSAAIDAERRTIRDRLDALKEEVRGPLTAWETAEADRVAGHENSLVTLIESPRLLSPATADHIRTRIASVRDLCKRDWQEFHERAEAAATDAIAALEATLALVEQQERDAAELAELRRLKADREEADRIAAAAAQAAEKARQEAEQKAARDAAEAERVAEWQRKREEQAERDVQAAVAAAIETDRRIAAEKKAAEEAAERKRQENKRHRAKVHAEIRASFIESGFAGDVADMLVSAIADGDVPHVSITY